VVVEFQVIEELEFHPSLGIDLSAMEKLAGGLYIEDIAIGDGEPLTSGDQPLVRYELWLFDASPINSGEFDFILGEGQVIAGFDQGILDMRVGGVRRLIVPPAMGYGAQAQGTISPGSVLVFEIEILSVLR
jgi:FKBP-type peptidyl-prolyl cis-trans isomerase